MFTICVLVFAGTFSTVPVASECHNGMTSQQVQAAFAQCREDDRTDPIMTCQSVVNQYGVVLIEYTDITIGWTVGVKADL